ncbi:MAG: hypothetical protein HLUCCA01_08330 [Bacteroidetes bacterium HLUCCA01]|nr:MAG: hypothetical protein HLUCCA01_08330 [Bacteroidetes bacterium HLUCCA01]
MKVRAGRTTGSVITTKCCLRAGAGDPQLVSDAKPEYNPDVSRFHLPPGRSYFPEISMQNSGRDPVTIHFFQNNPHRNE